VGRAVVGMCYYREEEEEEEEEEEGLLGIRIAGAAIQPLMLMAIVVIRRLEVRMMSRW